jgi:hypothetical protein
MSIIAAVANNGDFYFTINKGINSGATFVLFLMKLSLHLETINKDWRSDTVFLVDNAPFHKSKFSFQCYEELKLPITFLGPY